MGIGKKIESLLQRENMKVCELAKKTGISSSSIYSMIARDSQKADLSALSKIARTFCVDISYFCDESISNDSITLHFNNNDYTEEQLRRILAFAKFIQKEGL